jgi:hypothetical protein
LIEAVEKDGNASKLAAHIGNLFQPEGGRPKRDDDQGFHIDFVGFSLSDQRDERV